MRILALADTEEKSLYEEVSRAKISKVDLIISCGDLGADYLSYISTVYGAPLFFVRGNHDQKIGRETPLGENLHNRQISYKGYKFLGFEGCPRYNAGPVQYSEKEMAFLVYQSIVMSWFLGKPDIIIAHATPQGIHEGKDYAHRGFPAFNRLIAYSRPRYFLHGHNHLTYTPLDKSRVEKCGETSVINVYRYFIINLD